MEEMENIKLRSENEASYSAMGDQILKTCPDERKRLEIQK